MKITSIAVAAVTLACLFSAPAAGGQITRVAVSKNSKLAKELGFEIKLTANGENSGLEGTTTFEFRAPKGTPLNGISRAILRIKKGEKLVGRLPLELSTDRAGARTCHFQLTPAASENAILELLLMHGDDPSGILYQVDLSSHTKPD